MRSLPNLFILLFIFALLQSLSLFLIFIGIGVVSDLLDGRNPLLNWNGPDLSFMFTWSLLISFLPSLFGGLISLLLYRRFSGATASVLVFVVSALTAVLTVFIWTDSLRAFFTLSSFGVIVPSLICWHLLSKRLLGHVKNS